MMNYLFYIRKRINGHKWMTLLNIAVSSLALSLLVLAITIPQILNHCEYMINTTLSKDISKYGVIRNGGDAIANENVSDYIFDIYNSPEIEGVGTWDYAGFGDLTTQGTEVDYWQEIQKIHANHHLEFNENPEEIPFVYMLSQAYPINDLKLYCGSDEQVGTNDGWLLFLGYNFRNIPIGTIFTNDYGTSYTVEGIFRKNTKVVDEMAILWNLGGLKYSCSVTMDNMVMVIPPYSYNYHSESYFFMCADGYSYDQAVKRINEVSEKYHIQTEVGTLADRVDTVLSDFQWMLDSIIKISGLLIFSSFIISLTTQLLTILSRKEELGVWIISGIEKKKIFKILMIENMFKMLISCFVARVIILIFEKIGNLTGSVAYELRYILWGNVPILLLLSGILLAISSSLITIAYVEKKSIPEIITGTWE